MSSSTRLGDKASEKYFNRPRLEIEPLLPPSVSKVLELGCGAGGTTAWLRSIRTVSLTEGIEISAPMAERARASIDVVHVGDLDTWSFALSQTDFDLVLALDVLEHLRDPWAVLSRVSDHMQRGGTLIASIPNIAHYSVALPLALKGKFDYAPWGLLDKTHLRFFTLDSACELIESSGFTISDIRANKVYPNLIHKLGLKGRRWDWYNTKIIDHLLPKRLLDFQFLIKAKPSRN